jgi:hypothetical protein
MPSRAGLPTIGSADGFGGHAFGFDKPTGEARDMQLNTDQPPVLPQQ